MNLESFNNTSFDRGASTVKQVFWLVVNETLLSSSLPGSAWRCWLLRVFGARIGRSVVIKSRVRIKFPWKLIVGNYSWIGENVWIDNLEWVKIGSNSCVSQGAYLCTGSHDWSKSSFNLIAKPIVIGEQAWVSAFCKVAPGVTIASGSVCVMGSVVTKSTREWEIWGGNPFGKLRDRPRC